MRDQKLFEYLETNKKSLINDNEINECADNFNLKDYNHLDSLTIKNTIADTLINNPSNKIIGHTDFVNKEFIIGVTQYIDSLIMKYGFGGLQILEHDYAYYHRLNPKIEFAKVGNLQYDKPLIVSMPFAGHCDVHYAMDQILEECQQKNIPVHLDCAWLSCAEGINFNISHPSIKSFACSLSKAYSLHWNRIGIRWSRQIDDTDPITIYNNFSMYNESLCKIGYHMIKKFPINFYWQKYRKIYFDACKKTFVFPTKIIWLAKDLNGDLYGMSKLLSHLHNVGMSN